jgi:glucuronoarabinoxylan endo-1,4-beta-xylanase
MKKGVSMVNARPHFAGAFLGIFLFLITTLLLTPAYGEDATGSVNLNVNHQQLDGFGASGAWYEGYVTSQGGSIYNVLFRDLGLDIYRIRNTYQVEGGNYMTNTSTIISNANASLGRPIRVMISSWSPPASLKSNGSTREGTLARDDDDPNNSEPYYYVYKAFADWWRDSLIAWSNAGVDAYYINMQNEPGFTTQYWDTCKFDPTENSTNAGYKQAFAALYADINTSPNRPLLLAPEHQSIGGIGGTTNYVNALNAADKSNVYGYSHHLYGDGDPNYPDSFISRMTSIKSALAGDGKPLLQTEYSRGGLIDQWANAMNLATLMHNALTVEEVSAYLYWELFWPSDGEPLVSVTSSSYTINPIYYAFKHFSYFTEPNWYRVDANTTSSNLRISAYTCPYDTNLAIVIINTSSSTDVSLTLSLTGFVSPATWLTNEMYRSTSTSYWASLGQFNPYQPLLIPAQSITTIHLVTYQTCAEVQSHGYWLLYDINSDCYIDYLDLKIIADNWLRNDCNASNDWCDWADLPWSDPDGKINFIDFNAFAPAWMKCNNPQDANCKPSW